MNLALDVRDPRLPGGRLSLSSGTSDPETLAAYRKALLSVLKRPDAAEFVRRLKLTKRQPGKISLPELRAAVEVSDLGALLAVKKAAGEPPKPAVFERAGLGRVIDRFMQQIEADKRPATALQYRLECDDLERTFGVRRARHGRLVHDVPVADISSEMGQSWLKGPKEKAGGRPWSPKSQKRKHSVAKRLWEIAAADESERAEHAGIQPPPLRNFWVAEGSHRVPVRPAAPRRRLPEFLTRSEAARVLWAVRGTPRAAWIALGVYQGLRQGELRHLRTGIDVDLEKGVVRVQSRRGRHTWLGPKSDNGLRTNEISRRLGRWLRAHVQAGYAGEYFFRLATSDEPFSENTAVRWTRAAFTAGGVRYGRGEDGKTTHTLRHTCATWLAYEGVSPATIAEILGDTVETVMGTYLHAFPHDRKRALELLSSPANRLRK